MAAVVFRPVDTERVPPSGLSENGCGGSAPSTHSSSTDSLTSTSTHPTTTSTDTSTHSATPSTSTHSSTSTSTNTSTSTSTHAATTSTNTHTTSTSTSTHTGTSPSTNTATPMMVPSSLIVLSALPLINVVSFLPAKDPTRVLGLVRVCSRMQRFFRVENVPLWKLLCQGVYAGRVSRGRSDSWRARYTRLASLLPSTQWGGGGGREGKRRRQQDKEQGREGDETLLSPLPACEAKRFLLLAVVKKGPIRDLVQAELRRLAKRRADLRGVEFEVGHSYYQHTKAETIGARKVIILRDRVSGQLCGGEKIRAFLGLQGRDWNIQPKQLDRYQVFVQSKSVNRSLVKGTALLYHLPTTKPFERIEDAECAPRPKSARHTENSLVGTKGNKSRKRVLAPSSGKTRAGKGASKIRKTVARRKRNR